MKKSEIKIVNNLISVVANAIVTDTIPEALEYLKTISIDEENECYQHAYNVLETIFLKTQN